MPIYIANTRINHDHKIYEKGEKIEMGEKQARPLLLVKALAQKKGKNDGANNLKKR